MSRRAVLAHAVLALLAGAPPVPAAEVQAGEYVMGTILQARVVASETASADAALRAAMRLAHHWDAVLTTWRPHGELAQFNSRAGQAAAPISPDLDRALGTMLDLAAATSNAFHPGAGRLIVAARTPGANLGSAGPMPPLSDLLERRAGRARLLLGFELDAGAIGKGIALDAMAQTLRAAGVEAFFLDFGGSSQLAWSRQPLASPWRLVVAGLDAGQVHGSLTLWRDALSTSRSSQPGDPAGPIVDPATGQVVLARRLVTVRAADATQADAWSTALVVRGRAGLAAAQRAGMEVLLQDEAGVSVTSGFWREKLRNDLDNGFQNR